MKTFLEDNEMDANLRLKKMYKIRNKDLISKITGWGLWGTGAGIMLNEYF